MSKSLSISYAMKKKQKKMADGGQVKPADPCATDPNSFACKFKKGSGFAEGGEVAAMKEDDKDLDQMPVDMNESTEHADDDLVMRIMRKRYSKGGMVANDTGTGQEADKLPNQFDDLVLRDELESDYDGVNAGDFLGNAQEDSDRKDIVARIMASRKKKDKLPNPR